MDMECELSHTEIVKSDRSATAKMDANVKCDQVERREWMYIWNTITNAGTAPARLND